MAPDGESTGISCLDYVTNGLPPHALTFLLGRPGTGKTVLAMQIGMRHARQGKPVVVFSAFSEPHERLYAQMSSFAFFDADVAAERVTMLSLKSLLPGGEEAVGQAILQTMRERKDALIIIDGYRGLAQRLGSLAAQDLLSTIAGQLPYLRARCIITHEGVPGESEQFFEMASADVLIALYNTPQGSRTLRTLDVLKIRGHAYREGTHGLAITEEGITVYPRLAASLPTETPSPTAQRYAFDLPVFDAMLGGGLPENSTTVFIGEVGTGRSTFSLQYMLAGARHGQPGLFITVGDTAADILQKADDLNLNLRDAVTAGLIHLLEVPPVEVDPYRLAWQIHERVRAHGIKRLAIDSATNLEAAPGVQTAQPDYLVALSLYFRRAGVTTVFTQDRAQYGVVPPTYGAVRMPTANNRVLLRRVTYRGRLYRICSVLNMQRSEHDTTIHEFTLGRGGVKILDTAATEPDVLTGIASEQPVVGQL